VAEKLEPTEKLRVYGPDNLTNDELEDALATGFLSEVERGVAERTLQIREALGLKGPETPEEVRKRRGLA
jgi:hypothetical protein